VNKSTTRALLVLVIALAGPTAFGIDLVAREIIFRDQPADLRAFFSEHATSFGWFIVPLPLLGGIIGFLRYPAMLRAALAKLGPDATETAKGTADLKVLLLTTTMAQAPALLGDLSVMMGARLTPALCSTSISVTAVILIGLLAGRAVR
jgi:hypothetical protein